MMRNLITICARGGSKGIPGKNVREINGIPLIGYTIRTARQFSDVFQADIALSTDSDLILEAAAREGLTTDYRRPGHMATDTAGKLDVIRDVMLYHEEKNQVRYDYVLDLDVTAPLRNADDLKAAFDILQADPEALNLFSVSPCHRNPYFNMVEQDESGYYTQVKKGSFLTRQSAPKVYDLNASFYFFRRHFFETEFPTAISDRSLIYEVPHICFDLDHTYDFLFLEFLITHQMLDFSL